MGLAVRSLAPQQLLETQAAFDSVAAIYDGPAGNNPLIQHMRCQLWRVVEHYLPEGGRLLDLGCGAGLDVEHFARQGYSVTGVDWSLEMVRRTRERLSAAGLAGQADIEHRGVQQLGGLDRPAYDGIYSNLGVLNCAPDLHEVAGSIAALLRSGGIAALSVMGRWCPWEIALFLLRGDWRRAAFRWSDHWQATPLNGRHVWSRYFTPPDFVAHFMPGEFQVLSISALSLLSPPPYMQAWADRHLRIVGGLQQLDRHIAGWPVLRNAGDHFLVVMRRR